MFVYYLHRSQFIFLCPFVNVFFPDTGRQRRSVIDRLLREETLNGSTVRCFQETLEIGKTSTFCLHFRRKFLSLDAWKIHGCTFVSQVTRQKRYTAAPTIKIIAKLSKKSANCATKTVAIQQRRTLSSRLWFYHWQRSYCSQNKLFNNNLFIVKRTFPRETRSILKKMKYPSRLTFPPPISYSDE